MQRQEILNAYPWPRKSVFTAVLSCRKNLDGQTDRLYLLTDWFFGIYTSFSLGRVAKLKTQIILRYGRQDEGGVEDQLFCGGGGGLIYQL